MGAKNGVTKWVKVALATIVTLAFIFIGLDLIKMLIKIGDIKGALMVIGMYVGTMAGIVNEFLRSGKEATEIEHPAGCKSRVTAEITCD